MKSIIGKLIGKILNFLNNNIFEHFGFKLLLKIKSNDDNIFLDKKLLYNKEGFYFLSPKFLQIELDDYYKNKYLKTFRKDIKYGIIPQDFFHYEIMKRKIPNFIEINSILNFGSGHGGISHIFDLVNDGSEDLEIINIDLTKSPLMLGESRISYLNSIKECKDNYFDLIYSSHSLEHVADLEETISEFKRVIKKTGVVFLEVPNAEHPEDGPMNNKIDVPHTYYFKKDYFTKKFNNIYTQTFNKDRNNIKNWEKNITDNGRVIISIFNL